MELDTELFGSQRAWEKWLKSNHKKSDGLWLMIAKKSSSVQSVTYDEALDVALCYGWIDGQKKSHDADHFLQKFTPRRKGSMWSKRNVDKVATLIEAGLMKPAGQAEIEAAKANGRWDAAYASSSNITVPKDFEAALSKNKKAKAFFDTLNKTQRYSFLWRIETAKRADTREGRIEQFIKMLANHETIR